MGPEVPSPPVASDPGPEPAVDPSVDPSVDPGSPEDPGPEEVVGVGVEEQGYAVVPAVAESVAETLRSDWPERASVPCGVARRSLSATVEVDRVSALKASPPRRAEGEEQPYWRETRNDCADARAVSRPPAAKAWAATAVVFAFAIPSELSSEPSPA